MLDDLPVEVSAAETILRGVKHPAHVRDRKGKIELKSAALKSVAGTDDVSVMRLDYMGLEACRGKAKEICGDQYLGLATLKVGVIRDHGSDVHDSRSEFWGHAHIAHGVVLPPDEPPDSEVQTLLNERIRNMLKHAKFERDPDPSAGKWSGGSLEG